MVTLTKKMKLKMQSRNLDNPDMQPIVDVLCGYSRSCYSIYITVYYIITALFLYILPSNLQFNKHQQESFVSFRGPFSAMV